ncbi:MAG: protein tyrosine phosphatase family protein [Planctomycetota bacterium]|jgi:protein tyrosine phosphatase (PTP) superfamily phosphohydrolase (DUF442 family)
MRITYPLCSLCFLLPLACSESNAAGSGEETTNTAEAPASPNAGEERGQEAAGNKEKAGEHSGETGGEQGEEHEAAEDLEVGIRNAILIDGTVLLGGQPSEAQFGEAADKGYQVIVTLRGDGEPGTEGEKEMVEELDMRFIHIPMANGGGYTEENARALAAVLDDPANHPVMVHCGSGNRVGGLFALKAFFVDGLDPDAALEVGRSRGMQNRLEGRVKSAMK